MEKKSSTWGKYGGGQCSQVELFFSMDTPVDIIDFLPPKPHLDPVFLHQKYVVEGLSTGQIAKEIFFSKGTIRNALIKASIPIRRSGSHPGNPTNPRYGTRKIKGKTVPLRAEQKVIKTIIKMRDEEGLSFRKIADFLTCIGVPTKRRGVRWSKEVIRTIYMSAI